MAVRTRLALVTAVALAILGTAAVGSGVRAQPPDHAQHKTRQSEQTLHDDMRKLWEDHVTWTRMFIVEFSAGSPATDATAQRLLQNQTDIGDAIKPFYGSAAGEELSQLLTDHILIAADILTAAKAGEEAATQQATERWYDNADDIAEFLAAANPDGWPYDEMRSMMHDHLEVTLAQAVARLQGNFGADVAAYDQVHLDILHMADMLTDGIVDQFPGAFR